MKQSKSRGGLLLCTIGISLLIDCVCHLFFCVTETKRNFGFDCATCILYHNFSPNYSEFCCHGVDYPYTIKFLTAKYNVTSHVAKSWMYSNTIYLYQSCPDFYIVLWYKII